MVDPPLAHDTAFFRQKGRELREIAARRPMPDGPDGRSLLSAAIRDLMGARDQDLAPIEQAMQSLQRQGGALADATPRAALASLQQQLERTYNPAAVQAALAFAEGWLGLSEGAQPQQPAPPRDAPGVAAMPNAAAAPIAPSTQARSSPLTPLNLSLLLLVLLAGLGVIGLLLLRDGGPLRQAADDQRTAARSGTQAPAPAAAPAPSPAAATPQADTSAAAAAPAAGLVDTGIASGGQSVRLDLGSITPAGASSLRRFRYQLGRESINAIADCAAGTWTTEPEGETHSPQSTATARMLERICGVAAAAAAPAPAIAPAVSRSGAALVFDPPSNIRSSPNGPILCSVTSRGTIAIQGQAGDWYLTDACGSPGYIHRGQIRF
jgi:serine/threonine-protein kinase